MQNIKKIIDEELSKMKAKQLAQKLGISESTLKGLIDKPIPETKVKFYDNLFKRIYGEKETDIIDVCEDNFKDFSKGNFKIIEVKNIGNQMQRVKIEFTRTSY